MEAKELRIGNLLRDKVSKTELEVIELTKDDIVTYVIDRSKFPLEKGWGLEPIPLTEKWLKRFGYFIIETNKCVEAFRENFRYSIQQVENSEHWFWCDGQTVITNLKHVHQLQNFYFALTNEELTLTQ